MTHHPHHNLPVAVPPANRFTILVVDDEAVLRTMICRTLDRIGYATVQAGNPLEVIESLESGLVQPDMILSDVEMPELSGIEMVKRIRAFAGPVSGLPVLVASGNPSAEMRRAAMKAGADCFMAKPFELSELYAEVGALLRKAQEKSRRPVLGKGAAVASPKPPANRLKLDSGLKNTL